MTAQVTSHPTASADDRTVRWIGLLIVLTTLGTFGAWGALAPLNSAALAPGVLTVEGYRKTVQHLEGGIVRAIAVRDGQPVRKGDVLVTLDDTQWRTQLEALRGEHAIGAAREARLIAQRDGATSVSYPAAPVGRREDPRAEEAMRLQDQVFAVRRAALEGEVNVYRRQIEQLGAQLQGMRAQRASRERLVSLYREELRDFQSLLAEGYAEKQKVRELQRRLADSEGQLGELTADIAATEFRISETELKILQLNKDFQREIAAELSEVQAELFKLREQIQSLEDRVARTVVRAPESGMVLGLAVHTIGAVIPPGGRILDIVPQQERLVVEAQVSPLDIDRVKVGQLAEVRFTAFKSRQTPRIDGTLASVSADRLIDTSRPDATPYYLARIEVSSDGLAELSGRGLQLVPGMPAEVLINTGARTLFEYLAKPLTDALARSFIED